MTNRLALLHRILLLTVAAALTTELAACSSDDDMPAGTPFTQALGKAYGDLSTDAATLPAIPVESSFLDSLNPFGGEETSSEQLAKAFATKAETANAGAEPEPEAGSGPAQVTIRTRLVRALAASKDQLPDQAARAESSYDCWVLYGAVATASSAAQACRSALESSLTGLENPARMASSLPSGPVPVSLDAPPTASPPSAASSPPTAGPAAPAKVEFAVFFEFDSWSLKAEQLTMLDDVIANARNGGQGNIDIVGHTDTSGPAGYNQALSVRRANVVVEALVQMGARRDALHASGVGETGLAVKTADGVKDARNRRTVIDLRP